MARTGPTCPNCGYSLRGIIPDHCPECGNVISRVELEQAGPRGFWRVHAFHSTGLGVTIGVNVAAIACVAYAGFVQQRANWFTTSWLGTRRDVTSWRNLLLLIIVLSLISWSRRCDEPGWDHGWSMQKVLAVWCWILTLAHAAGALSLWL